MPIAPKGLLFGTAGVPVTSSDPSSLAALDHISGMGLDALEIEFVQGVKMGVETARKIRERAAHLGLRLSVHAPYFVNLNSVDKGKRLQSQERLLASARIGAECGARSLVFHAGFYGQDTPERTYEVIRQELTTVATIVREERLPIALRIETMGKKSQFGSLDEVLGLCRDVKGLQPCLDFSHLYAREGRVNSREEFDRVLTKVSKRLGPAALKNVHIHIAGIHFNQTGEIKHLNLDEADFRYDDWLEVLRDRGVEGLVICESPNKEGDALMLKTLYLAQRTKAASSASYRLR